MKKLLILIALVGSLAAVIPTAANASTGSCGGWYAHNRFGTAAEIYNVQPHGGMNCASSRYVVNKWLKRAYQRQWSNRIPTRFYDGYVTWHGYKTSGHNWRFVEYSTGTSFTFTGVYYGW
jgi:hypothetical protein